MFYHVCDCGNNIFRIYYSRDLMECHGCLRQYKISDVLGKIEVKHQR